MTASTAKVALCNRSLGLLRIKQITSIDNPTTNSENICAKWYDDTRRAILESQTWKFAIKRFVLTSSTETPVFGWEKQSAEFPTDFLRIISIGKDPNNPLHKDSYEIEGNRILTNKSAPYYLRYVADITDVSKYTSLFKMYLIYNLALVMAKDFGSSTSLRDELRKELIVWERQSFGVNGQMSRVLRITRSKYLSSRRHGQRIDITKLG